MSGAGIPILSIVLVAMYASGVPCGMSFTMEIHTNGSRETWREQI